MVSKCNNQFLLCLIRTALKAGSGSTEYHAIESAFYAYGYTGEMTFDQLTQWLDARKGGSQA